MVTKVSDTVVDTMAEAQFKYLPHESSGLNVVISAGTFAEIDDDGGVIEFAQQTLVLTDNSANYVYLEFDNTPATLEVSTTKPDTNIMLIHRFTAASGVVSAHVDYRWKTINNRYLQDPFWPTGGQELTLFKHKSSIGEDGIIIIRDLDTPYQRVTTIVEQKQNDARLVADDSTSGANAYGFQRIMSADGNRMIQMRNVNGSASIPFKAFERDSTNGNPLYDFVALADPPQMTDNTPTPVTAQMHTLIQNPVHQDIVLSGGAFWWVYDDNEDGTYTGLTPANSFDVLPDGSGQRTYSGYAFDNTGEWFCSAYTGGNNFQFYSRETVGARYQLNNENSPGNNRWNAPVVYFDVANQEFVFKTRTTDLTYMKGYSYNSGSGNWEEAWSEDSTTNSDWTTIDSNPESIWVSTDGTSMLIASRASSQYGLHRLSRRAGGGWDWEETLSVIDSEDNERVTQNLDYNTIFDLGSDYIYVTHGEGISNGHDFILKYEGSGSYRHVMDVKVPGSSGTDTGTPTFGPCSHSGQLGMCIVQDATVVDPSYAIFMKHDPLWYWTPHTRMGNSTFEYRKEVKGFLAERAWESDAQQWPVRNNDSTIAGPTLVAGPLTNTWAIQTVTGQTDIEIPAGFFDVPDYLSNTELSVPAAGYEGTIVAVWKTPTSWAAVSDSATTIRPLWAFGQTGSWPGTQASFAFGINIQSAGANAYLVYGTATDNGSGEASNWISTNALSLDTWYVTSVTNDLSEGGFIVHNNAIEDTTMTDFASPTVYNWPGGRYAWFGRCMVTTKAAQFMSQSTATGTEIAGASLHAIAIYDSPLAVPELEAIVSDYGL